MNPKLTKVRNLREDQQSAHETKNISKSPSRMVDYDEQNALSQECNKERILIPYYSSKRWLYKNVYNPLRISIKSKVRLHSFKNQICNSQDNQKLIDKK